MRKPDRIKLARTWLLYVTLYMVAVCLMMSSIGCQTRPAAAPGIHVPCNDPAPLDVPPGVNSAVLEGILFAAYLELRAEYAACQRQQVAP